LLKKLCVEFNKEKFDRLKISFWGGEPMLNYDFVRDIIKETSKFDFVDWHIFSNGTLDHKFKTLILNEEFSPKLKNGRLSVQISFDGEPHHSLKRGYNPSEFTKTVEILVNNGITFNFKGTLAADSLHLMPQCWDSYY
jgi:sulfatase maturation enzyme AslB (radical SAM superfamily)